MTGFCLIYQRLGTILEITSVKLPAINKKYLSEKALKALEGQPTLLKPWDPFGTLAD